MVGNSRNLGWSFGLRGKDPRALGLPGKSGGFDYNRACRPEAWEKKGLQTAPTGAVRGLKGPQGVVRR